MLPHPFHTVGDGFLQRSPTVAQLPFRFGRVIIDGPIYQSDQIPGQGGFFLFQISVHLPRCCNPRRHPSGESPNPSGFIPAASAII